jgi:hypothetical protein
MENYCIYRISDNGIGIPEEKNIRCLKFSTGWIMRRSLKEME